MDWISLGKQLADSGGWTAFVTMVIALGVGFVRGWIIPGWIYRDERARSDRIEAAMATLTRSVDEAIDDRPPRPRRPHAARRDA